MKKSLAEPFRRLHWSAKLVIEGGVVLADALLLAACAWFGKDEILSLQMVEMSVYLFSEGIVGGLLLDVIAKRMGVGEDDKQEEKHKEE